MCDLYKNSKKINNKYREKKDVYGKHVINIKKNKNFVDCEIKKIFDEEGGGLDKSKAGNVLGSI